MIRNVLAGFTLAAVACFALAQNADENDHRGKAGCSKGKPHGKAVADGAQCHGTQARTACGKSRAHCDKSNASCTGKAACDKRLTEAGVPVLMYRVGEKTTRCPDEAEKLAKGDEGVIRFVIGEKVYEDEAEAKQAYAKALEDFLGQITSVRYAVGDKSVACPMSAGALAKKEGKPMRYRLASYDFETKEAAKKAAATAREAADGVKMTVNVGDESFTCSTSAAKVAKSKGKSVEFCVGQTRTPCKVTASVNLAMARVEAALEAIEKAAQG
jgi:hypothetical protein